MSLKIPRNPMPTQDAKIRVRNFQEVALGYEEEKAVLEAQRCLNCKKPLCMQGCPVEVNIPDFIAEVTQRNFQKAAEIISSFEKMFSIIFKMLETNLQAFLDEDKVLAREALLLDNEIDEIYRSNFNELLTRFKNTNDESEMNMISRALILNKQIERAGDHLTNVSEQILYLIKGKRFNYE